MRATNITLNESELAFLYIAIIDQQKIVRRINGESSAPMKKWEALRLKISEASAKL